MTEMSNKIVNATSWVKFHSINERNCKKKFEYFWMVKYFINL